MTECPRCGSQLGPGGHECIPIITSPRRSYYAVYRMAQRLLAEGDPMGEKLENDLERMEVRNVISWN